MLHYYDLYSTIANLRLVLQTADGSCFSIDPLSGDFRENLTPVQVKKCDGSKAQQFDVITAGKHVIPNSNSAIIVSSLVRILLE